MRFLTYMVTTTAYSAGHALAHLHNRESLEWDCKRHCEVRRPMLVADKLGLGLGVTLYGFAIWPYLLHHDARRAELALRGWTRDDAHRHPFFGYSGV